MKHNKVIRWLLLFLTSVCICLSIALMMGAARKWISVGLGIGFLTLWLARTLRDRSRRNKSISVLLAVAMSTSRVYAEDSWAGYSGGNCYCFTPAVEQPEPEQHAIALDFILESNDLGEVAPRILWLTKTAPKDLVDFDGLNASLVPWGIDLNKGEQYAKNGQPATAADMPFLLGELSTPLVIYPELEQHRVVVEQATELSSGFILWQPVAYFSVPVGIRINFHDSPEGPQTFYRVRVERAPEDFQAAGPVLLGCGIGFLAGVAVICVLAVRQCAKNKKKFEAMLPPKKTNDVDQVQQ